MKIKSKIIDLIQRSTWYNDIMFKDCRKFWTLQDFDLDVVNLGSTSAVHSFCYDGLSIKGANWAMSPQSLLLDTAVLKNYFSHLKAGATVIIPLCPFSCFVGYNIYVRDRYYTILRHNTIPGYHVKKYNEVMSIYRNPERFIPLIQFLAEIKKRLRFHRPKGERVLTDEQMVVDAHKWKEDWMREFSISTFSHFIQYNIDKYKESVIILRDLISFCSERNLCPIVCIPPVSKQLRSVFDEDTIKFLVNDFVAESNTYQVPFYSYWDDDSFDDNSCFSNSYFLNHIGAIRFTKKVLEDAGLLS